MNSYSETVWCVFFIFFLILAFAGEPDCSDNFNPSQVEKYICLKNKPVEECEKLNEDSEPEKDDK